MATALTSRSIGSPSLLMGGAGDLLYRAIRKDVETSRLNVSCQEGACRVILDEMVWYNWEVRVDRELKSREWLDTTVKVASSWFNGDHRLTIVAKHSGTRVVVGLFL